MKINKENLEFFFRTRGKETFVDITDLNDGYKFGSMKFKKLSEKQGNSYFESDAQAWCQEWLGENDLAVRNYIKEISPI